MATFPNAFKKVFVGTGALAAAGVPTKSLTPGQLALVDSNTNTAVDAATLPKLAYLALGNSHTVSKIGMHGGYTESIKSKGINPRYVTRFWKQNPTTPQNQIVRVGFDGTNASTVPAFVCGETYNLRVDLKGSPVLRFLGRNAYKTVSAFTGCCANPLSAVAVDPATVLVEWAKQLRNDAIISKFITSEVEVIVAGGSTVLLSTDADLEAYVAAGVPADVKAALILTVNYVDTVFDNCSFDQFDHVETEPVVITTAQLVDETGDPCSAFQQITFKETQAIRLPQGLGESVLRDLILFNQYRIEPFQADPRKRQIEDDKTLSIVDRSKFYKNYYLLHSVPRFMNPSSTFDNDQYLIQLSFESTVDTSAIEALLTAFIASAGHGVTLEDFS
jgi:hypothetical protein